MLSKTVYRWQEMMDHIPETCLTIRWEIVRQYVGNRKLDLGPAALNVKEDDSEVTLFGLDFSLLGRHLR